MGTNHSIEEPIVFFDGVCNLCNGAVQFAIKRDKKGVLRFASLQSDLARSILPSNLSNTEELLSVILYENGSIERKSTAVLKIAKHLGGMWSWNYAFIIIPRFLRDWIYDFIAKRRYRWFGKKDQCMIPTPELKSRFLD